MFLTRKLDQLPSPLPAGVHASAYAPFSQLLPRARAFVHHGGIGTVSQALAAGVPQLVVAMALDQPDNAERVERLGAGIATTIDQFTAGSARPLLQRCLADDGIRRAAAACSVRMRARPAADAMVDWLLSREVPARRAGPRTRPSGATAPRPVFLVPGLGADSRTYRGPWDAIPGRVFVEWPEYRGEATIPAVARFVADAWDIPEGAVVVATSFAGAVACEIARIRRLAMVVLVAASPNRADYLAMRRMRTAMRQAPLAWIQRFLRRREGIRRQRYGHAPSPFMLALLDAVEQFSVCDLAFYRAMYSAMACWQGSERGLPPLLRIHGRHDGKVRPPAAPDLLLDAGHLVATTHAHECVDFIRAQLGERALAARAARG